MKNKLITGLALGSILSMVGFADAAMIQTTISGTVSSEEGHDFFGISRGDSVSFTYKYDNEGTSMHSFYLDGSIQTYDMTQAASWSFPYHFMSDASVLLSSNIVSLINDSFYDYQTTYTQNSVSEFEYRDGTTYRNYYSIVGNYSVVLQEVISGPGGNSNFFRVESSDYMTNYSSYRLDNVQFSHIAAPGITPPDPTPIPGAVWLLGSGLAGLIGLRRRNKA